MKILRPSTRVAMMSFLTAISCGSLALQAYLSPGEVFDLGIDTPLSDGGSPTTVSEDTSTEAGTANETNDSATPTTTTSSNTTSSQSASNTNNNDNGAEYVSPTPTVIPPAPSATTTSTTPTYDPVPDITFPAPTGTTVQPPAPPATTQQPGTMTTTTYAPATAPVTSPSNSATPTTANTPVTTVVTPTTTTPTPVTTPPPKTTPAATTTKAPEPKPVFYRAGQRVEVSPQKRDPEPTPSTVVEETSETVTEEVVETTTTIDTNTGALTTETDEENVVKGVAAADTPEDTEETTEETHAAAPEQEPSGFLSLLPSSFWMAIGLGAAIGIGLLFFMISRFRQKRAAKDAYKAAQELGDTRNEQHLNPDANAHRLEDAIATMSDSPTPAPTNELEEIQARTTEALQKDAAEIPTHLPLEPADGADESMTQ